MRKAKEAKKEKTKIKKFGAICGGLHFDFNDSKFYSHFSARIFGSFVGPIAHHLFPTYQTHHQKKKKKKKDNFQSYIIVYNFSLSLHSDLFGIFIYFKCEMLIIQENV